MANRRGHRQEVTIDDQTVWLDSNTEFAALERLIGEYGFSGKWLRPQYGIKHAGKFYSPDFELSVDDNDNTARALVEIKQYRKDFTKSMAERMCTAARHYHTKHLYLHVVKTNKWYRVISRDVLRECQPPIPGKIPITELYSPKRFTSRNYYGRRYQQSLSDRIWSLFR